MVLKWSLFSRFWKQFLSNELLDAKINLCSHIISPFLKRISTSQNNCSFKICWSPSWSVSILLSESEFWYIFFLFSKKNFYYCFCFDFGKALSRKKSQIAKTLYFSPNVKQKLLFWYPVTLLMSKISKIPAVSTQQIQLSSSWKKVIFFWFVKKKE